ncbi:MAG: cation-translocating P-type ATPase, partial [Gammaproteobacteria bacterium]|nr:cation-translocating P-type ATPase [Gammaproteobacteria bacterium]
GEPQDTIAILVIIFLNALIGTVQEYRAERAVAALREMAAPDALVMRDGETLTMAAAELVTGDIVLLETGNIVPADCRLLESEELQADESALTGESHAVDKQINTLADAELTLGDRTNLVFKSSLITRGRGKAVVIATGLNTEMGHIAELLRTEQSVKTPLQQRLTRFGRYLALAVLAICVVVFISGLLQGQAVLLMFLTAVSLAVAAIPEALPAVVTLSLAFGARKLISHHALVRNLPAVETLGSVTYICTDKTGTLTQNHMTAELFITADQLSQNLTMSELNSSFIELAHALALNNDVAERDGVATGEATELALYEAAHNAGFDKNVLEQEKPRLAVIAFDSERKQMTTLHQAATAVLAYVKGAPESVLPNCINAAGGQGVIPIETDKLLVRAEQLANQGYRLLAVAKREWSELPNNIAPDSVECQLTFLGMVALIDPPRAEVPQAVKDCLTAGITPVMITGDHPGTAMAIARRLGITDNSKAILTGKELAKLSDEKFAHRVETIRVYARVNPEQKVRIVRALQLNGEFVAMTGDGVNDAPALKRAGIGVAMGQKGTDVAREAADMVLLDDNFSTIVATVRYGRRIFDNIRKFIKYTMSSNSGEIWTLFLAPFLGLPIPLLPIHILWINLVTDGLPGLAFTAEPAEPNIMQRPPRPPEENIFSHGMWQHIVWVGLLVGGLCIAAQAWAIARGVEYWQTIVFTVLTLSQLFHCLAVRSDRVSLFTSGLSTNLPMLGAVMFTVGLQMAVIYVPSLNDVFHTQALPVYDLAVCFLLSSLILVAVEIEKWLVRREL